MPRDPDTGRLPAITIADRYQLYENDQPETEYVATAPFIGVAIQQGYEG
jgi:hypothetical protein